MTQKAALGRTTVATDNAAGIRAMLIAQLFFVSSDSFIKFATSSISAWQFMAIRGGFTIGLMFLLVIASGGWRQFPAIFQPLVLLRAVLEAAIAVLFITALANLPLGEITVLLQATPLILTILSCWLLAERVSLAAWTSAIVGLGGVILVVQPDVQGISYAAVLALAAAILAALRDLVTVRLQKNTPSSVVGLATAAMVCALGWAGVPFVPWAPMAAGLWTAAIGSAILVSLATLFMIHAFRNVDVSVVSPFRYFVVLIAMVAGAAFFQERPNLQALAGAAVIVLSGLALLETRAPARAAPDPDGY